MTREMAVGIIAVDAMLFAGPSVITVGRMVVGAISDCAITVGRIAVGAISDCAITVGRKIVGVPPTGEMWDRGVVAASPASGGLFDGETIAGVITRCGTAHRGRGTL